MDYDDIEIEEIEGEKKEDNETGGENKLTYSSIHSTSFKDHMLKNELVRALQDCGFENPSEGKPHDRLKGMSCYKVRLSNWMSTYVS
jgi:hypothetical protein